jgi:hypothetical protein
MADSSLTQIEPGCAKNAEDLIISRLGFIAAAEN